MSKSKQFSQCKISRTSSKPLAGDATCLDMQMSHHLPCNDRRVGPRVFCNLAVMKAQKSSKCVAALERVAIDCFLQPIVLWLPTIAYQQPRNLLYFSQSCSMADAFGLWHLCTDKMTLVLVFVTVPTITPPKLSSIRFANVQSWGSYSLLALYRKVRRGPVK
jgi:hypothetical protein